jgi:hypothetical protein
VGVVVIVSLEMKEFFMKVIKLIFAVLFGAYAVGQGVGFFIWYSWMNRITNIFTIPDQGPGQAPETKSREGDNYLREVFVDEYFVPLGSFE